MLEVIGEKENADEKPQISNNELFDIINENWESFSRKLKFIWLDYNQRREEVENITDELINILYKETFARRNVFMTILKEVIKNSADHSDSNADISLDISRNEKGKKILIKFTIIDQWQWLALDEEQILKIFNEEKGIENRTKKWDKNFWIWLGIIKTGAKYLDIDLTLHNKWKIIKINDTWKSIEPKSEKYFWYEWYWSFDLE